MANKNNDLTKQMEDKLNDKSYQRLTSKINPDKETPTLKEELIIVGDQNLTKLKKKTKKSYTSIRIEDDIVEMYRNIVSEFNLESHGVVMNSILRDWATEKLGLMK